MSETPVDVQAGEEEDKRTTTALAGLIVECALNHLTEWRPVWSLLEKAHTELKRKPEQSRKCLLDALSVFNSEVADETYNRASAKLDPSPFQLTKALAFAYNLLKVPNILVRWQRMQEHISFTRPLTFLILGMRGSGKSSLLEVLAIRYPKIIDVFGSSDSEGLAFCKPEFERFFIHLYGRSPEILLITGRGVDVASKWHNVKINDLKLSDFEAHDVIITVHAFYRSQTEYFSALQKITHLLWEKRTHWTEPWFFLVREAANWIYARTKIAKDDKMAKADFIQALREARHHGLAVGVDTIRWTSLDKEVRDVSDCIFLKRVGAIGLPDDLRWLYRYWRPYCMMQLRPEIFGLCTGRGAVGYGRFDYPPWHKEEKENILRSTNIEVKPVEEALPSDRRYGVGDFEHAEIIIKYKELNSMGKVAKTLGRAPGTVLRHINLHNKIVALNGECAKCFHANCRFSKETIAKAAAESP